MKTLRSTPKRMQSRDDEVFPALAQQREQQGTPHYYYLHTHGKRTFITIDAFFIPMEIEERLNQLYRQYLDWWVTPGNPARRCFRTLYLSNMHDYVNVCVLTEHAQWWIDLFNQAAPLTYNQWQVNRELHAAKQQGLVH